jgi:hypothetical protein
LPESSAAIVHAHLAIAAWLQHVDAGAYDPSWGAAAELFKKSVTRSEWEELLKQVRSRLGRVVSRTPPSAEYTEWLSVAGAGRYVRIRFRTSFEYRKRATETVTAMLGKDGSWRVCGYSVESKPA